ncbi:MAG: DHH family phosphoesterase [Candidatus Gastranaerophilales bacterium]|nr:DHH family phosphoesterase [Candidatus Gastranaerophilales bacterium]
MRLCELLDYDQIVVQCHDNPDADALASGFGVYTYLKERGKDVRFVYGGRYQVQKSNLVLMVSELGIPAEHVDTLEPPELLVTVDCQYGEGNVTRFEADTVAVIDHHQVSGPLPALSEVRSNLGACATVVRELLSREGVDINCDKKLATALYYGLLTDTNHFTEISHPLDKDLRDDAVFDRSLITRFRNANLSLRELEIAGTALMNYHYHEDYRYAVVVAEPCDPNILGMISDLMLEVDAVDTCLVYSVQPFGVKISVRSCVKEVKASELAEFITDGIGSGGGHLEKAGGFIQMELLEKAYHSFAAAQEDYRKTLEEGISDFLIWRMDDYFDDIQIIRAAEYEIDISGMEAYKKRPIPIGYVEACQVFPVGTQISVRTLEGDLDVQIQEDLYIMIGIQGEVYPNERAKFERSYKRLDVPYTFRGEYEPVVKDVLEGRNISLIPHAKSCVSTGEVHIYVKELDHRVKVFTAWDADKYMLGREGDFLAVRMDDMHDIYVIEKTLFYETYEKM